MMEQRTAMMKKLRQKKLKKHEKISVVSSIFAATNMLNVVTSSLYYHVT